MDVLRVKRRKRAHKEEKGTIAIELGDEPDGLPVRPVEGIPNRQEDREEVESHLYSVSPQIFSDSNECDFRVSEDIPCRTKHQDRWEVCR